MKPPADWPTSIEIPDDWPQFADYVLDYGPPLRLQRVNLRDFVKERVAAGKHLELYDLVVELRPGQRVRPFRMGLSWVTGL